MRLAERFGRHPRESALLAIVAGKPATPHVSSCALCTARLAELTAWARGAAVDAAAIADETFTPERLAAQKDAILRRLEAAGRSARVIAFPAGTPAARAIGTPQVIRWAAAAAVAGVMIGLASGRLLDPHTATAPLAQIPQVQPASDEVPMEPLDAAALLDAAYDRVSVDALSAIDDITPRAREIALTLPRARR